MAQLAEIMREAQRLGLEVERQLRADAVAHITDVLRDLVRDGNAGPVTVRIAGIPFDEWAELEVDESDPVNGQPVKREWLTGTDPLIVLEFLADPDSDRAA